MPRLYAVGSLDMLNRLGGGERFYKKRFPCKGLLLA